MALFRISNAFALSSSSLFFFALWSSSALWFVSSSISINSSNKISTSLRSTSTPPVDRSSFPILALCFFASSLNRSRIDFTLASKFGSAFTLSTTLCHDIPLLLDFNLWCRTPSAAISWSMILSISWLHTIAGLTRFRCNDIILLQHAWHKMQRIRPSWTVIAFSGFAPELNKNPRWRPPGVKNIEHLGAYFLSRFVGLKTYHLATSSKNK